MQEFVEEDDNQGRYDQLDDQEEADSSTEVGGLAVETGEDVDGGLAKGNYEGED